MEFPVPALGDDPELSELAERARAGSAAAFDALARRVRERVLGWAARLTRDEDDAEDVAQQVLLRLHERIAQFEGRSQLTTWLYSVTRRAALSRQVRERRRAALLARHADQRAHVEPDAAREEEHRAHIAQLLRAHFDALPRREREVFEMAELRGLTSSEIGRAMGVAPVTVRVMLLKARRKIRLRMLEQHPDLLEEYR